MPGASYSDKPLPCYAQSEIDKMLYTIAYLFDDPLVVIMGCSAIDYSAGFSEN